MSRVSLSEIHEQAWFPGGLRDLVTDALQFILNAGNIYRPIASRLGEAIKAAGTDRVVDLCSGGGGPWMWLHQSIASQIAGKFAVCLTDKYPNIPAFESVRRASDGAITYSGESIDAARIPAEAEGFRTIFSSFHHFSPSEAAGVLQDAIDNQKGIGIFEAAGRRPLNILITLLMPFAGFLTAPFIRPYRISRLFWTYLIPVIPFVLLFDGILSCLRAYSLAELSQIVSSVTGNDYQWEVGEKAGWGVPVTYLLGYPKTSRRQSCNRPQARVTRSSTGSSTRTRAPDVVIAGGGVAGSSLAIMLGRKGLSVELFERAQFPREKPCGEGLMPGGVAVLDRLNITNLVGGQRFRGVRYHLNGRTVEGTFPKRPGFGRTGIGQRRKVLDHVLSSEAAATSGVRIHTGCQVEGPIIKNGRVTGLAVQGRQIAAPLVVGADGMHSVMRQKLGLDRSARRRRFGIRAHFQLSEEKEQSDWVKIFVGRGYEIYVTPLPNNEITVIVLEDAASKPQHPKANLLQRCQEFPELASLMEGSTQVSEIIGASPLSGRAVAGVGRGFVLLGDAAGFLDPVTGGGMTQALMTAELLAEHVSTSDLSDDGWLWSFERERRKMLRGYTLLTQAVVQLSDRPRLSDAALRLLGRWPALLSHGLAVSAGTKGLLG
jgi:geranylgeranyl reductase family protein